jgi:hypothetical protein
VLLCDTRWNSANDCLENFVSNHSIYLQILCSTPDEIDREMHPLIKNTGLLVHAMDFQKQTSALSASLDKVWVVR